MEDTKSLVELSSAIGELEDRVTRLESMPDVYLRHISTYHSNHNKMDMFDLAAKTVSFLDKNGEILLAIGLVIVVNLFVWRVLD